MKYDKLSVAAMRSLAIDGINKAKSGHPGMALGSAPIVYTLFTRHFVANPQVPNWINRDRFVLSAGHASMLLYVMLHLGGYGLTIDDLKQFRQLGSLTPGHPEYKHTLGVDATSGPLGQGIATAVGMAMAEQAVQNQYKDGQKFMHHYTYCLCGDGCLEEGLSQEAISYAGLQKLNKLVLFYDSNKVTLDGPLSLSNNDDVRKRFEASHWNVYEVTDGNDVEAIDKAIIEAKKSQEKPTLIIVNTIIGFGSTNQGTSKVHGNPLGLEDGEHAKKIYEYDYAPFEVPNEVYLNFKEHFIDRGILAYNAWKKDWESYKLANNDEALRLESVATNDVSKLVYKELPVYPEDFCDSTRNESQAVLNILNKQVFNLMGGSADVAASVMTKIKDETNFEPNNRSGRNINFGIREFAMACIQNGMLLHGGVRTYAGCFLVFSDYLKPAIRMAALSKLPAIYLFSHDSIAVGEDGPTHQPIEQLVMLRSIPNVHVYRPCDAREVAASWKLALESMNTPSCLILSRQKLPMIHGSNLDGVAKGGYVISKEQKNAVATIIATGSEVSLAVEAQKILLADGIDVRVVSMVCKEKFLEQSEEYQEATLGVDYNHRISVEMLSSFGWYRLSKNVFCLDNFGASAPADNVIKHFGYTVDNLVSKIKKIV